MRHSCGVEVSIEMTESGELLPEYGRKVNRGRFETSVEARTDQPFGVQLKFDETFPFFGAAGIAVTIRFDDGEIYEDESLIGKNTMTPGPNNELRCSVREFYVGTDAEDCAIEVAFAELSVEDHLHPSLTDTRMRSGKIGTIHLGLHRVTMEPCKIAAFLKRRKAPPNNVSSVSRETMTDYHSSHIVRLYSKRTLKHRHRRTHKKDRIGRENGYIAGFHIHYGSLASLRARGFKVPLVTTSFRLDGNALLNSATSGELLRPLHGRAEQVVRPGPQGSFNTTRPYDDFKTPHLRDAESRAQPETEPDVGERPRLKTESKPVHNSQDELQESEEGETVPQDVAHVALLKQAAISAQQADRRDGNEQEPLVDNVPKSSTNNYPLAVRPSLFPSPQVSIANSPSRRWSMPVKSVQRRSATIQQLVTPRDSLRDTVSEIPPEDDDEELQQVSLGLPRKTNTNT